MQTLAKILNFSDIKLLSLFSFPFFMAGVFLIVCLVEHLGTLGQQSLWQALHILKTLPCKQLT